MAARSTVDELAVELYNGISLIARRLRQLQAPGELSLPERAALARLGRGGPATSAELARAEQITPQAMGNTLNGLENRGLIERQADPHDGRRMIMSLTDVGRDVLRHKRDARTQQVSAALNAGFTSAELDALRAAAPLVARLADHL
ncbi:MAG TPA: MarR family transcriptional regulator [Pseudonocardiaceae bacterium]|nr:MarR family transcriptional regulator [Pseudonocardiaceae bacterium]